MKELGNIHFADSWGTAISLLTDVAYNMAGISQMLRILDRMVTFRRKPPEHQVQNHLFASLQNPLGSTFSAKDVSLYHADTLVLYREWETPTVIISDGAYGLGLFPGDPKESEALANWYESHIELWSQYSTPQTTLWFWNSELGWANVHPILAQYGWKYISCHVWDKGIAHAAGNSNTQTLRKFPVVTEVCVQYVKEARIHDFTLQQWLRNEWDRTELPLFKANEACGVKNAATRKYLTKDDLWYFPPPEAFERLVAYTNQYGKADGRPYFSADGKVPLTPEEWAILRSKFYCKVGITNVWREPALNGSERVKVGSRSVHLNQKPLKLMELIIESSSDENDVIWEPFGGLCSGAVAVYKLNRKCFSAEINRDFYELAVRRFYNRVW